MSDNVVYLHGRPREVAQAVRIGFFDHRQAEHLWSANKLTARRFVIEAANVERQAGLFANAEGMRTQRSCLIRTLRNSASKAASPGRSKPHPGRLTSECSMPMTWWRAPIEA